MAEIPPAVREYLSTGDVLYRAELSRRLPELEEQLRDPATQAAVREWLGSPDAQEESRGELVANALNYLLDAGPDPADAQLVRAFLQHPLHLVRLRAYQYLASMYFRDDRRDALLEVLSRMMDDPHDSVRAQGIRLIERVGAETELRPVLVQWHRTADQRGFAGGDSYELASRLIGA
jgi:hypothetical protein